MVEPAGSRVERGDHRYGDRLGVLNDEWGGVPDSHDLLRRAGSDQCTGRSAECGATNTMSVLVGVAKRPPI